MKQVEKILLKIQKQEFILKNLSKKEAKKKIQKKISTLKTEYKIELGKDLRELHKIYEEIFFYYPIKVIPQSILLSDTQGFFQETMSWSDGKVNLTFAEDEEGINQAEIVNTWQLPLNERLELHKQLLNKLKRRYNSYQLKLRLVI